MEDLMRRIEELEYRARRLKTNPAPTVPQYGLSAGTAPPPPPPTNEIAIVTSGTGITQSPNIARMSTSVDGINWLDGDDPGPLTYFAYGVTSPVYNDSGGGTYFNGTEWLIACTNNTLHSSDGVTWSVSDPILPDAQPFPGSPPYITSVYYFNGHWLASPGRSAETATLYRSADGISWTPVSNPFDSGGGWVENFADNGSMIVAAGTDDYYGVLIMTSTDGVSWTAQTTPVDGSYAATGICWSPTLGLWIAAVSGGPPVLLKSSDAVTWVGVLNSSSYGGDVCWSPDLGLFVYAAASTFSGTIWTSPDGTTWTRQPGGDLMNSAGATDVVWHPGLQKFFVAANNGFSSNDGINWFDAVGGYVFKLAYDPTITPPVSSGGGTGPPSSNPVKNISGASGTYDDDNSSVTPSDPLPSSGHTWDYNYVGNGIFYKWVAPSNGTVTVRTDGVISSSSDIGDTVLYVLPSNSSTPDTDEIAENDDDHGPTGYSGSPYYSLVTFTAVAGTTYYFLVKGYDTNEFGTYRLSWTY